MFSEKGKKMFKKWVFLWCFCLWILQAENSFNQDHLNAFYDEFVCEEKNITAEIGLTSECNGVPPTPFPPSPSPPPPPIPPPNPPPPLEGYVPIVLVNNTGLSDSDVFFVAFGTQVEKDCPKTSLCPCPITGQTFVSFGAQPGPFNPVAILGILPPQPSTTYSYAFSDIPLTNGQRVIYIPAQIQGGEIIFSVFNPLNLFTSANNIAVPNPALPTDPNYSSIYQQFEFTFLPPNCQDPSNKIAPLNQLSIDITAVDYFSLPIQFNLQPQNFTAGILQTRHEAIQSLLNSFNTAIGTASLNYWNNLVIKSPDETQIIRILSPGESIFGPGAVPTTHMFDVNYFDDSALAYSWAENVWKGALAYYTTHKISISTSKNRFTGYTSGNSLVFTSITGGGTYEIPWQNAPFPYTPGNVAMSTSASLFNVSTNFPGMTYNGETITSANLTSDAIEITKMLSSAIIAGIIPGKTGVPNDKLTISGPSNSLINSYYTPNSNLPNIGYLYGPWYDLYSLGLIGTGSSLTGNIVYAYPYDDYLYAQSPLLANVAPTILNITTDTYIVIQINPYSNR